MGAASLFEVDVWNRGDLYRSEMPSLSDALACARLSWRQPGLASVTIFRRVHIGRVPVLNMVASRVTPRMVEQAHRMAAVKRARGASR